MTTSKVLLWFFLAVQTAWCCDHCPNNGKPITLPRANCVPNNLGPVLFDFDIDGYAGPDDDALAFTGEMPQINRGAVVYIERYNYGDTFRMMGLDFSIEFAESVLIRLYDKNYNLIDTLPPIFLAGNQRFVRVSRPDATSISGALRVDYIPNTGFNGVGRITMEFQSNFNEITFWGVYLDACTRGALWPNNLFEVAAFNSNNANSGSKLVKVVKVLTKWVAKMRRKNSSLGARLRTPMALVKRHTDRFDKATGSNYVYSSQPSSMRSMTVWLKSRQPDAQRAQQSARKELRTLEHVVLTASMSSKDRKKGVKAVDGLYKALTNVDDTLLETGTLYLTNSFMAQSSGFLDPHCNSSGSCPEGRFCCECRCRRPKECRAIAAQSRLQSCLGRNLDLVLSRAQHVVANGMDGACYLIDAKLIGAGINPALGHHMNELKVNIGIKPDPEEVPWPGQRPPQQLPGAVTDWLVANLEQVQNEVDQTRAGLSGMRRAILQQLSPREQASLNVTDLFTTFTLINNVLDIVDSTVLGNTGCYMDYALGTFQFIAPQ